MGKSDANDPAPVFGPRPSKRDTDGNEVPACAIDQQVIAMTPEEQLAFWTALNAPVKLTAAQKKLGRTMRVES